MTNNTCLALTIGPIYGTFAQCKRTRAVWASSYFFSWFIKRVTTKCAAAGFNVLLPHHDTTPHESKYGSGLYADRVYLEPTDKTKADFQNIVDEVIAEIAQDIDSQNIEQIKKYLTQFLNIHIVEAEVEKQKEVLRTLNEALDQQELKQSFAFDNETNYLLAYFDQKLSQKNLLVEDAFEKDKGLRFRSIPEIASTSIERLNADEYKRLINRSYKNIDIDFIDELVKLEPLKKLLKPYHKYYAVMYADGDNIGTLLKEISGDFVKLKEFSRQLFVFGQEAEKIIHHYGGSGIYLGGEDILAFLPMACVSEDKSVTRSIFDLMQQLDVLFKDTIGKLAILNNVPEPTLTYGIRISYIKHPLKESMSNAHELMEEVKKGKFDSGAKKFPCKNAVGFRFQKHSGQFMQCFYEKSKTCSWNEVKLFVETYTQNAHEGNAELLSGVIHRLKDDLFFETFAAASRAKRQEPFFENFFNEYVHKTKEKDEFIQAVKGLAEKVFHDYSDNQSCRDILFTTLRYVHFINSEKE